MNKICMLLSVLFCTVFAAELDEGVIVLTDANFDEELAKYPNILVEFYAPWCGHCKKLAPEYSAAAQKLAQNDPPYPLAKVDATENKEVAERFGIQGFPTLFFFKNQEKLEYTGGRTKDAIVQWIIKKSGPASTAVDCETLKKRVAENQFVIAFFGQESDALFTEAHLPTADIEDKINFIHTDDAACAANYDVAAPGLVFFRKFESEVNVYSGAANRDELQAFYRPLMVPTLFKFTEEEIDAVFGQQQNILFLFRSEDDESKEFVAQYADASQKFKGKILFSYADGTVDIQAKLAEFMGIAEEEYPTIRAITPANMNKYRFDWSEGAIDTEALGQWIDNVVAGTAAAHLKSEPVPENNNEPVTVLVGTTFDKIARSAEKDVFVKFYAPWCGHCKKLAPVWEELAEAFKDSEDMVIAKFDATANEAEGVNVRGYPTLIFYPREGGEISYDGERDLESMKGWLEENATALKGGAKEEL